MYFSILVAILAPNFITHARSVVGDKSSMYLHERCSIDAISVTSKIISRLSFGSIKQAHEMEGGLVKIL